MAHPILAISFRPFDADLVARRVAMAATENEELVTLALRMALARRNPQSDCFPLLHHSNRGSKYTSSGYQACLAAEDIAVCMNPTGNTWDNAAVESFFVTLKKKCIYR